MKRTNRLWRSYLDESGQALLITAASLVVLMGFMGLAIDVGMLLRTQRQMQIAADAAAVAGALDYKYNASNSSAVTQGCNAATANGVTGTCTTGACTTATSVQICMMSPPNDGPNKGTAGFVEAVVRDPAPTFFMRLFRFTTVTVSGRAVAGASGSGAAGGCVIALSRTGDDISYTGSGGLTAEQCDIYDDSSASNALTLTGSGSITGKAIGISGNYSKTGSGTISPAPVTGMAPIADPLATLPAPTIPTGSCTGSSCTQSFTGSTNHTLQPGTYTSISNTGSGTLTLAAGNYIITGSLTNTGSGGLVLGAGNYTIGGNFESTGSSSITIASGSTASNNGLIIVGGTLELTGSGPLTDNGETFYTEGSTTVTGSSNLKLTAPTSGTYDGMLLFQSRTDSNAVAITGSSGSTVQGIVYAPDSPLTLTGSGTMTVSLDVIADSITETGSGQIDVTNYANTTNTNSVLAAKLVMVE